MLEGQVRVFESQLRIVERSEERSTSGGYPSQRLHSKGMYLGLQGTRILVGFWWVSAASFLLLLRVEFLLKTDSGYPKDTGVNKPWQPLGIPSAITPIGQLDQSPPLPIPGDLGRGPSHQSTCSNIETRMDRPKSVVRVIRGVA